MESYLGGDKNWLYGTLNYPENRALAILCWEGHIAKFPTNVMEQQNTLAAQLAEVEDVKPVVSITSILTVTVRKKGGYNLIYVDFR